MAVFEIYNSDKYSSTDYTFRSVIFKNKIYFEIIGIIHADFVIPIEQNENEWKLLPTDTNNVDKPKN